MPHANKEDKRAYHAEYMRKRRATSSEQREKDVLFNKRYRQEHKERLQELHYIWRLNNPDKWKRIKRRSERRRHASTKCGFSGVSIVNSVIECVYDFRDVCIAVTKEEHHVDHIQPLSKGGLHVPWNLQVLLAVDNLRKSNKLDY